jgi:hypothetical protein
MPLEELQVGDLTYQEYPVKILDTSEKPLQDVQSEMEQPYRRRGYLGKRRSTEDRISRYLFQSVRISGVRFILGGVGL